MILPDAPGSGLFPINSQLVPVVVVRALRGIDADAVLRLADAGKLRFVWNVGVGGARAKIPVLRFWLREVITPASVAKLDLPAAIALILGASRTRFRGTEINQLLMFSRTKMCRLNKSGDLPGKIINRTLWVARPTLEKFFIQRFLFG